MLLRWISRKKKSLHWLSRYITESCYYVILQSIYDNWITWTNVQEHYNAKIKHTQTCQAESKFEIISSCESQNGVNADKVYGISSLLALSWQIKPVPLFNQTLRRCNERLHATVSKEGPVTKAFANGSGSISRPIEANWFTDQ